MRTGKPKSDKPLTFTSQSKRAGIVLGALFRWLSRAHRILAEPRRGHRAAEGGEAAAEHVLTVAEVERILGAVDVTTALGVRDRAILETLYSTGMRRMELCALSLYDVDLEQGIVKVRQGKGSKDRVIPIGARAVRVDREVSRRGAAGAGRRPRRAGAFPDDVWGALRARAT